MAASKSTQKTRNNGRWTEGRYRAFITSALRGAFRRYPPKYEAIKAAFTTYKTNKATGRKAAHFKCAECKKDFPQTMVQVDHLDPVVEVSGFVSWDVFIERLFCEPSNLQVLCKPCHLKKSKKEKEARK